MQRRTRRWFLGTSTAAVLGACAGARRSTGRRHATLVVRGGTVWTGDAARPRAQALAIAGDTIVAVGGAADIDPLVTPQTAVIELAGGTATPGLCDAHAHLVGLGQSLEVVDLRGAGSIDEVVARLRRDAPAHGWVQGRGWDQNLWPDKAMPTHAPLTAAFPDRPVWLRRIDGHAGWGNAALLKAAKIDRDTKTPEGGEILRDADGAPTGVLVDAAMGLVPPSFASKDAVRRFILAGAAHATARGLTGVHEMGIGPDDDEAYRQLADAGELPLRVHAYAGEEWLAHGLSARTPDPVRAPAHYLLRGVKLYADGALGSRGAALLADYSDRPGHRGLLQHPPEALRELVAACIAGGWQIATHAIGDAANRAVLDAYAAVLAQHGGPGDRRLRIEHCQIVDLADIARFAELGVVASMQPTHATSDMSWVPERIGTERLAGAYAWRRFLDARVPLAFGSDFPVEQVEPTHGLFAAITRTDEHGRPSGGWLPDQRLDLAEALRAFTATAAFAGHRETHLGVLRPGMQADVTCFAGALDEQAPATIRNAQVLATIVAGRRVFAA